MVLNDQEKTPVLGHRRSLRYHSPLSRPRSDPSYLACISFRAMRASSGPPWQFTSPLMRRFVSWHTPQTGRHEESKSRAGIEDDGRGEGEEPRMYGHPILDQSQTWRERGSGGK